MFVAHDFLYPLISTPSIVLRHIYSKSAPKTVDASPKGLLVFLATKYKSIFFPFITAMAPKKFSADVLWWDSSNVHVQCPFCGNIHRHGFGQSYGNVHRVSHCDTGVALRSYSFKYPFSQNPEWTAYEIDKVNERYVALGASPPQPEQDLLAGVFTGMKLDSKPTITLPRWEDATEIVIIDDDIEEKRINLMASQMIVFGDANYVRKYLDSSPENHLFIHGVDDEGKTALQYAACEKYPAIVKLLLERGADPNHQTKDGRTPLMEATLWGRYESVEHLLEKGANKNLVDNDRLRAIDLATPSDRNEEERYRRSGGKHQVYKEDTYTANQARRMIVSILKDDDDDQSPLATHGIIGNQLLFHKSPGNSPGKSPSRITIYAPVAEHKISTPYKTIARLERGGKYPSIAAKSGWGHGKTIPLVSGRDWTSEVIRIADLIGHALIPDNKDNGIPGKFHACHAEKQLIAYFISKHVFLSPETRDPKKASGHPDTYYDPGDDESGEEGGTLYELAAKAPPVSLKQASIFVSSPPCDDCIRFKEVVNAKLDLRISVQEPLRS